MVTSLLSLERLEQGFLIGNFRNFSYKKSVCITSKYIRKNDEFNDWVWVGRRGIFKI